MSFRRLLKDSRGSALPMFGLAIIPVVGLVGAALDFGRAMPSLSPGQLQQRSAAVFQTLFAHPDAKNVTITPNYASGGMELTPGIAGSFDTPFMKLAGYSSPDSRSPSTARSGNARLRVALALDNTGSMASAGKMDALKAAAKNLLTQLQNAATANGDVYVSIIPFSKAVNVGKSNDAQSHIRWEVWDAKNGSSAGSNTFAGSICYDGTLWQIDGTNWTNGGNCSGTHTGICYQGTLWSWNGRSFLHGGSCANHASWNGCVTDRDRDHDTTEVAPLTLFPPEHDGPCLAELMPLSRDWTELNKQIDAMKPAGKADRTTGLQRAFQSLTAAPFAIPSKDANDAYSRVIILLTDGPNTQNRLPTSQPSSDARTRQLCDTIKAAGVTLYTLQVNTDGDPTSTMLQQCASDDGKFFQVTSASQIGTIFRQIGTNLANLQISP